MVLSMDKEALLKLIESMKGWEPHLRRSLAASIYPEGFTKRLNRWDALSEAYELAKKSGDHKAMASIAAQL